MVIYNSDKTTAYTCSTGQEGSDMVSVFIDKATNEVGDTTFEFKDEDGGLTITTTKAFALEISKAFAAAGEG